MSGTRLRPCSTRVSASTQASVVAQRTREQTWALLRPSLRLLALMGRRSAPSA